VVVGYDGSPAARAAVSLAVDRVRDGGSIVVVHAYELPADWYGWPDYNRLLEVPRRQGEDLLKAVEHEVPGLTAVPHETELIAGPAAKVLATVAESRHASEVIVGTRGFGRARALLGSVAHELLHLAPCPVTAIPVHSIDRLTEPEKATVTS